MNIINPSSKNNMSVASSSGVMKPIGKSILRALSMELAQAEEEVNGDNNGGDRCRHPGCDHGGAMPLSLLLQQHHEHLSDQDLEALLLLSQQQEEDGHGGAATADASTDTTGGDEEGDHMVDEGEESFRMLRNETSRLSQCQHQHRYNHSHSHEQPPPSNNNNNNMNPEKPATNTIRSSLLMSDLRKLALSRKYQQQQQQNSPTKRSMTLSVSELRRLSEAYEYVPDKHRNKCYATLLGLAIAVIATSTNVSLLYITARFLSHYSLADK